MKLKTIAALILTTLFLCVPRGSAQTGLSGRWSTDPAPTGGWMGWNVDGVLNTFRSGPPLAQPVDAPRRNFFPQGLLLDLKINGTSVTGFLSQDGLWVPPMRIELGTVEGMRVRFLTARRLPGREPIFYQWVAELIDGNTMSLRGGNITGGRGGEGRPLQPGRQPAPTPTALPPLNQSSFLPAQTLHRVS